MDMTGLCVYSRIFLHGVLSVVCRLYIGLCLQSHDQDLYTLRRYFTLSCYAAFISAFWIGPSRFVQWRDIGLLLLVKSCVCTANSVISLVASWACIQHDLLSLSHAVCGDACLLTCMRAQRNLCCPIEHTCMC